MYADDDSGDDVTVEDLNSVEETDDPEVTCVDSKVESAVSVELEPTEEVGESEELEPIEEVSVSDKFSLEGEDLADADEILA